ncbi:hypothetical protein TNCV_1753331 [Trichonephila clavipes]|nr:hypothetical protein TNCV_1753331 [Trichonephila clavipes]
MSRFGDLSVKRDLQCLRLQASLVLIYRPNVAEMKGRVELAQPVNRTKDLWFSPRRAPTLGDKPKKRQARTRWRQVNVAGQGGS